MQICTLLLPLPIETVPVKPIWAQSRFPEPYRILQVISTALGYVLPNLISRKATQHAASVLYTFFGLRLLYIAWHSKPQDSNQVGIDTPSWIGRGA